MDTTDAEANEVPRLLDDTANLGDSAPITEAVLDIRLAEEVDIEQLRALSERLAQRFPVGRTKLAWSGQFNIGKEDGPLAASSTGVHGFLRLNGDSNEAVHLNRSGFTFSKLRPYSNWAAVQTAAVGLWAEYIAAVQPRSIRRLAVRYINHIVPSDSSWDMPADWIRVVPQLPRVPGIPAVASEFHMKVSVQHPHDGVRATITAATVTGVPAAGIRSILLDIDVSSDVELAPESPEIWRRMEVLRDFKNDLFFGSLTERTRRMLG